MPNSTFHETYSKQDSQENRTEALKNIPEDAHRVPTTETSPRIISMLRFKINFDRIDEILSTENWPFLSLRDLVELSKAGVITCPNLDQLDNYLASWNQKPLTNVQAEKDLTQPRVDESNSNHLFSLIPISAKRYGQKDFDGQDKYLLLHFDEEVLSPGEPTSTRLWLNALAKYYDFSGLKVAEVFAGAGPAAVLASIGGAKIADCYELNERANSVATENYRLHGVSGKIIKSNVWSAAEENTPKGGYDMVLANPPFNPKPTSKDAGERLIEMVQDQGYQVLIEFLKGLPHVLSETGKAIVLYEDLPVTLDPNPEMAKGQQNAIKILTSQFNSNPKFPYIFNLTEKIRLRRFRGQDQPLTTFVVIEITIEKKDKS